MCQAGGTRRGTPPPPGPIPISAHAATVDVAHSRTPRIGGNRGIMRNSTISSGRGPVPMCVDPPDRTWEPNHHTRPSPKKTVIPTKTSPHPAETPVSHVQRLRHSHHQAHPPPLAGAGIGGAGSGLSSPTHTAPSPENHPTGDHHTRSTHLVSDVLTPHNLDADCGRSRRGARPISRRNRTDLDAEMDRSRREFRPISRRNRTDLGEGVVRG